MLLYGGIALGMIYLGEIGGYFWHKYAAHENILKIPKVKESHEKHHTIIDDQAHEDFIYILVILIILGAILFYLYYIRKISFPLLLSIFSPLFLISVWNYKIHCAYHIDNHWLNRYEWFRNDKRIHFQHHDDPKTNYGISTHFSDVIFDTFDYGLLKNL